MSSSSPTTTSGSRSPSPRTPQSSPFAESAAFQADFDPTAAWFIAMHRPKSDTSLFVQPHKFDDEQMLQIDDLLEQHAFDESPPTPAQDTPSLNQLFLPTNLPIPSSSSSISVTKPALPPPPSLPRKQDATSHTLRIVNPPKESCFDLPIMFPSIPKGGTKSRVETQIRVTVDLADANSSGPHKYNCVGSWKWLKLPPGTFTKRRTRKQGKIDASPHDTLNLITDVVCDSAPSIPIVSCSSCRIREAKRVAKKIAARVRPARSESESAGEDAFGKPIKKPAHEDTNSIIQFNCAEVLDFSTGSIVLPLRITCYCRHHREKVGFLIRFTMVDNIGRVVGAGISRPIMITDDHKTASTNNRQGEFPSAFSQVGPIWPQQSVSPLVKEASPSTELRGPTRRKDKINGVTAKRRPKPYESFAKPGRGSREGSISSLPSPSTVCSPLPMPQSPTPSVLQNLLMMSETASQTQSQALTPVVPALQPSIQSSDTSSPDVLSTPLDHNSDIHMPEIVPSIEQLAMGISLRQVHQSSPTEPNMRPQIQSPAPQPIPMMPSQASTLTSVPAPLPFLFFDPTQASQNLAAVQMPVIHRLIPNMGPTYGGIEVTVLGANFHSNLNLQCIFGEVVASSTQRWSDNALVCLLPPRAQPGIVAVWFEGVLQHPNMTPSLFTYSDESDRALMELALQVVGLKMTGKIEDAKNVAMRIVGGGGGSGGGSDEQDSHSHDASNMQLGTSSPSSPAPFNRDFRSLLFGRAGEIENFEKAIIGFLSILDTPLDTPSFPHFVPTSEAISQATSTGQTLLHLAAYMRLPALVDWLIGHEADIDARDKNGYTALHFAVLAQCSECARIIVNKGADREIVNCLGKTAEEIAPNGFFKSILPLVNLYCNDDGDDGDVESEIDIMDEEEETGWGDVEEDGEREARDEIKTRKLPKRRAPRRAIKKSVNVFVNVSGHGTPRRSIDISRAVTPPSFSMPPSTLATDIKSNELPPSTTAPPERSNSDGMRASDADAKQTASFIDLIHRTFAQLSALSTPTTLLPKTPQLALAGKFSNLPIPDLKGNIGNIGMPGWNTLSQLPQMPQIPMVFPVFVPTPAWPSFLVGFGNDGNGNENCDAGENRSKVDGIKIEGEETVSGDDVGEANKTPNAREWRAIWERWFALVIAKQQQQQVDQNQDAEDIPPPEYTPRAEDLGSACESINTSPSHEAKRKTKVSTLTVEDREVVQSSSLEVTDNAVGSGPSKLQHTHPVGYNDIPVPREELDAYTYQSPVKQKQKRRKDDRMLLRFWLPVLLLSVIWAFYIGLRFAYTNLHSALPLKRYV